MNQWFKYEECPVCGKTFYPESMMKWGWKTPKGKNVCSYTCQRVSEKNPKSIPKPKRKRKAVRVIETGRVFESIEECAVFYGVTRQYIYNSLNLKKGRFKDLHLERVIV